MSRQFKKLRQVKWNEKLNLLQTVSGRFEETSAVKKKNILSGIASLELDHIPALREYHNKLLSLLAYPENKNLHAIADKEIKRVQAAAKKVFEGKNERQKNLLTNTGIVNTQLNVSFSFQLVKWLEATFSEQVSIFSCDADEETMRNVMCACLLKPEADRFTEQSLSLQEMIAQVKSRSDSSDIQWLLRSLSQVPAPPQVIDQLYDSLKLYVSFVLNETHTRSAHRKIFYHRRRLLKKFDASKVIRESLRKSNSLSVKEKSKIIAAARIGLAMYQRETDPVTYANEEEAELFDMGRGIDIALFPMIPVRRLSLESYIGYVAFKNRIPVAYGGGWIFAWRSKIGINVFPGFRGGECVYLFSQILRLYHHHYNVKKFIVEPYQLGKGNAEGLKSGAFWFYYRLGFLPAITSLRQLAADEFQKIQSNQLYRSSLSVLRRLANSNIELDLSPAEDYRDFDPHLVSKTITEFINERFGGNGQEAQHWTKAFSLHKLKIREFKNKSEEEQTAFESLSLIPPMIYDLDSWSKKDKEQLAALMFLKGGKHERDFVLALQKHKVFLQSLFEIAHEKDMPM